MKNLLKTSVAALLCTFSMASFAVENFGYDVIVEAENYAPKYSSVGALDNIYTFWGTTTFVLLKTDDMLQLQTYIPEDGYYELGVVAASQQVNDTVSLRVQMNQKIVGQAPVNGYRLDVFIDHTIADSVYLEKGSYQINIEVVSDEFVYSPHLDGLYFTKVYP